MKDFVVTEFKNQDGYLAMTDVKLVLIVDNKPQCTISIKNIDGLKLDQCVLRIRWHEDNKKNYQVSLDCGSQNHGKYVVERIHQCMNDLRDRDLL